MVPLWRNLSRNRGMRTISTNPIWSTAMSNPYDENEDLPAVPSEKVLKIVEDISSLTLLEAADMSMLLKKRLRIQNVPVMSMGMNVMHDMWYEAALPPIPGNKPIFPAENGYIRRRKVTTEQPRANVSTKKIQYELPSASETEDYVEHYVEHEEDIEGLEEDEDLFKEETQVKPKKVKGSGGAKPKSSSSTNAKEEEKTTKPIKCGALPVFVEDENSTKSTKSKKKSTEGPKKSTEPSKEKATTKSAAENSIQTTQSTGKSTKSKKKSTEAKTAAKSP